MIIFYFATKIHFVNSKRLIVVTSGDSNGNSERPRCITPKRENSVLMSRNGAAITCLKAGPSSPVYKEQSI